MCLFILNLSNLSTAAFGDILTPGRRDGRGNSLPVADEAPPAPDILFFNTVAYAEPARAATWKQR